MGLYLTFWGKPLDYNREVFVLFTFFVVGGLIYVGFAEYSTVLWDQHFDVRNKPAGWPTPKSLDPNSLGLVYQISTRLMLFGLFISGVSGLVLCKKLERFKVVT